MKFNLYTETSHVHLTNEELKHIFGNNPVSHDSHLAISGDVKKGLRVTLFQGVADTKTRNKDRYKLNPKTNNGYMGRIQLPRRFFGLEEYPNGNLIVSTELNSTEWGRYLLVKAMYAPSADTMLAEDSATNVDPSISNKSDVIDNQSEPLSLFDPENDFFDKLSSATISEPVEATISPTKNTFREPVKPVLSFMPAPKTQDLAKPIVSTPAVIAKSTVTQPDAKVSELKNLVNELNSMLEFFPDLFVGLINNKLVLEQEIEVVEEI